MWTLFGGALLAAAAAMDVQGGGRVRGLGFLRLPGQDFPFWFGVTAAAAGIVLCLAILRRLAGGRVAAAIRCDGIELRGLSLSRYIPWRTRRSRSSVPASASAGAWAERAAGLESRFLFGQHRHQAGRFQPSLE